MSTEQRHLGHYELQQSLGRNAIHEVWKAFDPQQKRPVAINIVYFPLARAESLIPRFLRETHGLMAMKHPNIAQIFDVQAAAPPHSLFSNGGDGSIVMEYIEGSSLAEYLQSLPQNRKLLSAGEILQLLAPLASAIDYAHHQGIIHGLIKPSVVLFDRRLVPGDIPGQPRLVGFGMHSTIDPQALPLKDVYYLAPEISQGYTDNVRSDIYSLGVILYELFTGKLPFRGDSTAEVIAQQDKGTPTSPALVNIRISSDLSVVILRALAREPHVRFASATALLAAVADVLNVPLPALLSTNNTVLMPSSTIPISAMDTVYNLNHPDLPPADQRASLSTHTPPPGYMQSDAMHTLHAQAPVNPLLDTPAQAPLPLLTPPTGRRKNRVLFAALIVLLVLLLIGVGAAGAWFFLLPRPQLAVGAKPVIGHAFFFNSGLIQQSSTRGIADRLRVDLQNIAMPATGKSYYAWLLSDTDSTNALPILLGILPVANGHALLTYNGDTQNSNLLSTYSRFLVTEEDASAQPLSPSLDPAAWRYSAAFSTALDPKDLPTQKHYSLLDHLRHLLAQDPTLQGVGIVGGLDTWLFRNTQKIIEWSGSARDGYLAGDFGLMQRQLARVVYYLDGSQMAPTDNLPAALPPIDQLVDPIIAKVGLLTIDPSSLPPSYLTHISLHLREIAQVPGVTPYQQQLAITMNADLNNVTVWFKQVHKDATQLLHMDMATAPRATVLPLLNDLSIQANNAFIGQIDPHTDQLKEGVAQLHYKTQRLATFDVSACTASNKTQPCS